MSRRRGAFLCFDVDRDLGLKFHCEVVVEDGDPLDEFFYQSFIELFDVAFLPGDEALLYLDAVHNLFLVMAVELGLFLLVAESENFISEEIGSLTQFPDGKWRISYRVMEEEKHDI